VEKNQSELCLEILRRFHKAGLLDDFILIGSWCLYFFKDHFSSVPYVDLASLKTRDVDFLIDRPARLKQKVNVPKHLEDLGFVYMFKGNKGYTRLDHPDLFLEFLVPEKGKGLDKPYPLPNLGVNAATLRFLNFLTANTSKVKIEDFYLTLPHPANFALHKLIIYQRRSKEEKAIKDKNAAVKLIRALINKGEKGIIKDRFNSVPKKWQKQIILGFENADEKEILNKLEL